MTLEEDIKKLTSNIDAIGKKIDGIEKRLSYYGLSEPDPYESVLGYDTGVESFTVGTVYKKSF